MRWEKNVRTRIARFLLIFIMVAGLSSCMIPGMAIRAEAADRYKVLLWVPQSSGSWGSNIASIKSYYEKMSDIGVEVVRKDDTYTLTREDLEGVQLVYLVYRKTDATSTDLLGEGEANVSLLNDYVNAGGRIIMNGENARYYNSNMALSKLAEKLGAKFAITDIESSKSTIFINDSMLELTEGCEKLHPNLYTDISTDGSGTAKWLIRDEDNKVFAVDQNAGLGHITAISDLNWLIPNPKDEDGVEAAKRFLRNLLVGSAHDIEEMKNPSISVQPKDIEWYVGDDTTRSFTISAESPNGGTLTYQWYKGDSPDVLTEIDGAKSSTYTIPEPEKMDVGEYFYKCIVTNTKGTDVGTATSIVAKATVLEAPKPIIEGPDDLTWIYGDDSEEKFEVSATSPNGGTLSYQWYKGDSPDALTEIPDAISATYTIPEPEKTDVGEYFYKCIVTNTKGKSIGTASSRVAKATVLEAPKPIIEGPDDLTWIYGDDSEEKLEVRATSPNGGTLSYQWYRGETPDFLPVDGEKIIDATEAVYSIPAPEREPVGVKYYKCIVTNTKGTVVAEAISKVATVTVLEIPGPTVKGPEDIVWYYGDNTARILSVTATSPNGGTLTYQWYRGDGIDFVPSDENRIEGAAGADYSIPNPGTMEIGKYYYRCIVTNSKGTESVSVTSQTATATVLPIPEGDVEVDVEKHENTPDTTIKNLTEDVAWENATDDEKNRIKHDGLNGRMWLEITNIDNTVPVNDKQSVENEAASMDNAQVGVYLDFSMFFRVGAGEKRKLERLKGKGIDIEVTIPENLRTSEYKRIFYLVNVHEGIVKKLGSSTADIIPATLTDFSTYAIIYKDEITESKPKKAERPTSVSPKEKVFKASIEIKQDKKKIIIRWGKMPNVAKVEIYATYCKTKYPAEPNVTSTSRKATLKKINGKKIDTKRTYKMCLVAYDSSGEIVGKTLDIHVAGKDVKENTNPKSIKLSKSKVTLTKGQSVKIKAKIKLQDKKKKELDNTHCARFRYVSSDPDIAKVDKKGNITGVSSGTCEVYVVCRNGLSKKVAVTVVTE